jgi:hypothetical protein
MSTTPHSMGAPTLGGPKHTLVEGAPLGPPNSGAPWGPPRSPSPGSPGGWLWQGVKPRASTHRALPKLGSRTLPPRPLSGLPPGLASFCVPLSAAVCRRACRVRVRVC